MGAASGDHTGRPALGQRTLTACGLFMCDGQKKTPEGAFFDEAAANYFATTRTISRHLLE
jgi:hypothetical protein